MTKKGSCLIFLMISIFLLAGCNATTESNEVVYSREIKTFAKNNEISEEFAQNLEIALNETDCSVKLGDLRDWEQIEDWWSGERYRTCYYDSTEGDVVFLLIYEKQGVVCSLYDITDGRELIYENTETVSVESLREDEIRIIDGQAGEYGQLVQLDSYEYYWYMIPAGTYEATCNSKNSMVYVDKNEITRNSDGYVEMENVATYRWAYGETITIVVGEDEHLFNVVGADYTLNRVD